MMRCSSVAWALLVRWWKTRLQGWASSRAAGDELGKAAIRLKAEHKQD